MNQINKSKIAVIVAIMIVATIFACLYFRDVDKIYLDGKEIVGAKAYFWGHDVVNLPLRPIVEAMGGKFTYYSNSTMPVTVEDGTQDFYIRFGDKFYVCRFSMDAPYHQGDMAITLDGANFRDDVQLGMFGKIGEGCIYKDKIYLYEWTACIIIRHFGYDVEIDYDNCKVYITSGENVKSQ